MLTTLLIFAVLLAFHLSIKSEVKYQKKKKSLQKKLKAARIKEGEDILKAIPMEEFLN